MVFMTGMILSYSFHMTEIRFDNQVEMMRARYDVVEQVVEPLE